MHANRAGNAFEREIGLFVAGEDIASILPSIVVRFYIFGIKEKLLLTNGYEIEFKSPLLCSKVIPITGSGE